jgi:hypothetical protein
LAAAPSFWLLLVVVVAVLVRDRFFVWVSSEASSFVHLA